MLAYPPGAADMRGQPSGSLRQGGQDGVEQADGSCLVERLVAVAALGRLDARRAARLALARRDRGPGGSQPRADLVVPPGGETGAAGVAVVDEDGYPPGVLMQRGRNAADVPSVTGCKQREQPDCGVLGGVGGAGDLGPVEPVTVDRVCGQRVPDRAGPQLPRGQVQRRLVQHLSGGDPAPDVGDDLVGDVHRPKMDRYMVEPTFA